MPLPLQHALRERGALPLRRIRQRRRRTRVRAGAGACNAADAGKAAVDDAAAKAKDGILAEVKTKVDAIQGQLDGVKKQIDALPELVRKPAQSAFAGCEKKYTDLKASFANLQKAAGDEFKKLSGEVGSQATALSDEIGKIVKK
jgi:hypothetical protein